MLYESGFSTGTENNRMNMYEKEILDWLTWYKLGHPTMAVFTLEKGWESSISLAASTLAVPPWHWKPDLGESLALCSHWTQWIWVPVSGEDDSHSNRTQIHTVALGEREAAEKQPSFSLDLFLIWAAFKGWCRSCRRDFLSQLIIAGNTCPTPCLLVNPKSTNPFAIS